MRRPDGNRKADKSTRGCDQCRRGCDDFGQAFGRPVGGKLRRIDPTRIVELAVQDWLSFEPTRGKAQDDEMTLDPVFLVAHDRLAMARERDRLDFKRGLFAGFTDYCVGKGLAHLNGAARQGVQIEGRLARAAHDQHLAAAKDGGTDRQVWTLRIGSLVGHALYRFISLSTTACGDGASVTSSSPLMIEPARAISGFSQLTALSARAAIVTGFRSAVIAARVASSTTVIVTASVSRLRTFGSAVS